MKNRSIHENLDTSFVNLSALIKYLRRRSFVGVVRVELTGYEADVWLTAANELNVREHDRIAGRIAEGEEALQRLLIRAREPGGNINVYQEIDESTAAPIPELKARESAAPVAEMAIRKNSIEKNSVEEIAPPETFGRKNSIQKSPFEKSAHEKDSSEERAAEKVSVAAVEPAVAQFIAKPPQRNGNHKNGNQQSAFAETSKIEKTPEPPNGKLPPLPFDLSNKYEAKARRAAFTPQDWQMLLNVAAELLNTVDQTLAEADLDFAAAFEKARGEIAHDYPFFDPAAGVFTYKNGKIIVREQINPALFAASINEALRRILEKLGRNPKFTNVYLTAVQKIILLIEKRRPLYDKFSITPRLSKIIGI